MRIVLRQRQGTMAFPVIMIGHNFAKRLASYIKSVHKYGKGGAKLGFVQSPQTGAKVALLQPRVVVIAIGTNIWSTLLFVQ